MNLTNAIKVGQWLNDIWPAYLDYLDGGDRVEYTGNLSGDWDSKDKIRVSKLGSECPKYNAAKAFGLAEKKEISLNDRVKFADATRRAEQIYEAIAWGCTTNSFLAFDAERRIETHWSGLSGTIDGVLGFAGNVGSGNDSTVRFEFPVEVKRTDANKFKKNPSGISYGNFLQTIGEMILLSPEQENYGYCNTGYIYTTYSFDSTPTHKVWIVRWDAMNNGWLLLNARTEEMNEWPRDNHGQIFINADDYMRIANDYKTWMFRAEQGGMMHDYPNPYIDPFVSWHCGKEILADYYKSNSKWGSKGDLKEGTGIYIKKCPLFDICWHGFKYLL